MPGTDDQRELVRELTSVRLPAGLPEHRCQLFRCLAGKDADDYLMRRCVCWLLVRTNWLRRVMTEPKRHLSFPAMRGVSAAGEKEMTAHSRNELRLDRPAAS
jgi:hypothetical protein